MRALVVLPFLCGSAFAQSFPTRAVTLVVPFPPGGGPDLFARILAERLPPKLGQPVIVENRPGVGGLAGANAVAKAAPDGHTVLIAPNTILIAPHILPKGAGGGVDVMNDLVPGRSAVAWRRTCAPESCASSPSPKSAATLC